MENEIKLFDVIALSVNLPEYKLQRGEIGTIVECHSDNAFEVEFVAQDGYTYALVTLHSDQFITLKQKRVHSDSIVESARL